ncbi:MAG: hypothetical protein IS632_07310 [Thaumarchaeota archaeon]|nr:hypothetical protein [Nitrososphaerota archaeon]
MSKDPLNIDDCWDASSIRAKIKALNVMAGYAFDRSGEILATLRVLRGRLNALGEES